MRTREMTDRARRRGSGDWPLLDVLVVMGTPETIGRLEELFTP
jgi:hypothetical protein